MILIIKNKKYKMEYKKLNKVKIIQNKMKIINNKMKMIYNKMKIFKI